MSEPTDKISVCFNHYRGEGGTAEEIAKDFEIEAESEDVPSSDRRSTYNYITLKGTRDKVMAFLEEYGLENFVDEENLIEDDEIDSYYIDEGDDAMM